MLSIDNISLPGDGRGISERNMIVDMLQRHSWNKGKTAAALKIKDRKLHLNVENVGPRSLPLESIKVLSVVKIAPPGQRQFLLIDLWMEDPAVHTGDVRAIRLLSTHFNPQTFIPNTPTPLDAFRVFLSILHNTGSPRPYPDLESIQMQKLHPFVSVEAYETHVITTIQKTK